MYLGVDGDVHDTSTGVVSLGISVLNHSCAVLNNRAKLTALLAQCNVFRRWHVEAQFKLATEMGLIGKPGRVTDLS